MKWRVTSIVLCVSALLIAGCRQKPDDSGAGATTSSSPLANVGTVQSSLGFTVIPIITDSNVAYYFHEQSSFSSGCSVTQGETNYSKQDIYCMLDMKEADLYYNPITLNWNVPAGMCPYTQVTYYSFYRYQPSPNPYSVSVAVTLNSDGTVHSVTGGTLDSSGTPQCAYDYSGSQGPNCCEGTWTVTTTDSTGGTSSTTGSFTGHRTACLDGPGMKFSKLDSDGAPMSMLYRTYTSGVNAAGTIAAPINPPSGSPFGTNLYNANYFDPADLGAGSSTFPSASYVTAAYDPFYEFDCLDEAFEHIARIRILIRSWDTLANFTAKSNPYDSGNQTNWGDANHDRSVWKNYLATYPGKGM